MQTPDDEKFKMYLKRFDPIAPEPIPTLSLGHPSRRSFRLGAWLGTTAAIVLIVGVIIFHKPDGKTVIPNKLPDVSAHMREPLEPLTMRSANTLLNTTPSFKAAIDELAFRSQSESLASSQQSAIAVLSKEKIKL